MQHPYDYAYTDVNNNESLYALRKAMAINSGKRNIESLPVFKAPTALHSHLLSDALGRPKLLALDKKNNIVNSHELGHAIDHSNLVNRSLAASSYLIGPSAEPYNKLLSESAANLYSLRAIQQAYKDDPELLNKFYKLRYDVLTPAYSTYMYNGANDALINHFGSDIGNILGANLGLHENLRKQNKQLRNIIKSRRFKRELRELNNNILKHYQLHNYYE